MKLVHLNESACLATKCLKFKLNKMADIPKNFSCQEFCKMNTKHGIVKKNAEKRDVY